ERHPRVLRRVRSEDCGGWRRGPADPGSGTDGHIAFNEPGSSLASRTRIKTLTPQTRLDNARFFDGDLAQVPQHCITQGLGTIMEARHVVLFASGEGKAEAAWNLVEGPVSAM